ncbi:MAG: DUF92 domain-containing protein [Acidobacteriota bacterium]
MRHANEAARRAVHVGAGGLAFLLKYLTFWQAAACALAAVGFNLVLLPRFGGAALFRDGERAAPLRSGILLYPVSVLLLILLFGARMEVAAAGWGIMAAGDAAAAGCGRRFGWRPIPWNAAKTVGGSGACAIAAAAVCWLVLVWMGRGALGSALLAIPTGLFAAFVESLRWRLNDNLTVPLLSALFLRGLLEVDGATLLSAAPRLRGALLVGALVNLLVALLLRRTRTVDRSGALAGFLVGTLTFGFAGWRGYLILIGFFVMGSAATRLGYRRKLASGTAQPQKGARSARHALANCGVAAYLAVLMAAAPSPGIFALAFVCACATAAFDTVSSEIGQAYGGRPFLITTLRRVAVGTDGAVSAVGTAAGAAAALVLGGLAWQAGLVGVESLGIVVAAAFFGSTADSLLGATLEARGLMDNEAVNFSNTLVGVFAGIALARLLPVSM